MDPEDKFPDQVPSPVASCKLHILANLESVAISDFQSGIATDSPFLSVLESATIYSSRFKIRYKFNILTDREVDTQVPDKQCHCGIFFTHSQAFNSHLDTDHQPEEGYPNGKWPCNEEPSCSKEYDEKGKAWRHIRQKHRNIHSN